MTPPLTEDQRRQVRALAVQIHGPKLRLTARGWLDLIERVRSGLAGQPPLEAFP